MQVEVTGFAVPEEAEVRDFLARFADGGFRLDDLERVAKAVLPGYCGLVTPRAVAGRRRLVTVLELEGLQPFTLAHELAHVSDIAVRQGETRMHIAARRSKAWHLAHRMTSEYYANRVACRFCADDEAVFPAFQNDRIGLIAAARQSDWAHLLINYALLLGIFHGLGREDVEPLDFLPAGTSLPPRILSAIHAFRADAPAFWADYGGR
ncbi:hypothetical protein [Magnetospirillum sp. UT-4]|uniref:hypothetical protein n=1 Tax=Magnetospirillum sp. UT-4 TaxID=2681467 RepID=UPI001382A3D7|nr:hypothetical protein [Magnetospirillum sp. UT-4]CAA7626450.1 hypothetical protein MTBUT4_80038 [Magnetospirillum sp. UT-4]